MTTPIMFLRSMLTFAGILRIFFVQQATFCVNSLAHWLGDQPFGTDDMSSEPKLLNVH